MERSRDVVAGQPLTLDYFMRRAADGWRLAAVEWVREGNAAVADSPAASAGPEEIPYGLKLSADGLHLEHNPPERAVLLAILEKVVRDERVTQIAAELNMDGLKTRGGGAWTASAVFDLLPRLIEAGPNLLKSGEWREMRNSPRLAN